MKFDYCTIVFNEQERDFLPLHLNSLNFFSKWENFNIKVCVVEGDSATIEYCKRFPVEIIEVPIYVQHFKQGGCNNACFDNANRLDILVRACSSSWVVVSHLDIVYRGSLLNVLKQCDLKNGAVGNWKEGLLVVNREAYLNCHLGFWPCAALKAVDMKSFVRLHGHYCNESGAKSVEGVDVGDFFIIEMQGLGYYWDRSISTIYNTYEHIGEQSGHSLLCINPPDEKQIERKKQDILNRKQAAIKNYGRFL